MHEEYPAFVEAGILPPIVNFRLYGKVITSRLYKAVVTDV
jgi:hypothetical protein